MKIECYTKVKTETLDKKETLCGNENFIFSYSFDLTVMYIIEDINCDDFVQSSSWVLLNGGYRSHNRLTVGLLDDPSFPLLLTFSPFQFVLIFK